jgi:hypothetical protein
MVAILSCYFSQANNADFETGVNLCGLKKRLLFKIWRIDGSI